MKIWGIIATIFLVVSLCLNVWYYTETTSLSASIEQQLYPGEDSEYQLPFETMTELKSNVNSLIRFLLESSEYLSQSLEENDRLEDENWRLKNENEQLRATLTQIQQEAERAQEYGMWESLLQLIFYLSW